MKKLILANSLAPGDILVCTTAFRDLHKAYPGEYETDFRVPTGCEQIFENNPHITRIADEDPLAQRIQLEYPDIHQSGWSGRPWSAVPGTPSARRWRSTHRLAGSRAGAFGAARRSCRSSGWAMSACRDGSAAHSGSRRRCQDRWQAGWLIAWSTCAWFPTAAPASG